MEERKSKARRAPRKTLCGTTEPVNSGVQIAIPSKAHYLARLHHSTVADDLVEYVRRKTGFSLRVHQLQSLHYVVYVHFSSFVVCVPRPLQDTIKSAVTIDKKLRTQLMKVFEESSSSSSSWSPADIYKDDGEFGSDKDYDPVGENSSSSSSKSLTMSGFTNGNIRLDEERDIYYTGQVLSGKIEFGFNQPLQFKAINLIFHGEANVSWEETEVEEYDGVRSYNTIQYGGEEVFFHVEQCVCGGVGVSQLQAGRHEIPFEFQIPPTVPSSFGTGDDDEERTIYYYVKAVLEYHDGRESEELEEGFEVVVPLDLNLNPDMKVGNELIFEEAITSCLCGSGLLKVTVSLPATGFVPGQTVPISVTADNHSSVEIVKILMELVQRVKYFSTDPPSKKEEPETMLQHSKTGAVPAKSKRNFEHNFQIPDLIAVITQNCNTIKVGYFFKVKLVLSGCNDDLEDDMEICLGQIPVREMLDGVYEHPLQSDLPRGPIPNPGQPPIEIPPYVYPSQTLQVISNIHVSSYPGSYAPPSGYPYPGQTNTPYPGSNSYPGANPPYPGDNSYPGTNPPYPGANPPYPGGNPPYNGGNPPYPIPAPAGPVIGFVASPGYPPATGAPTPYNPSAPPQ